MARSRERLKVILYQLRENDDVRRIDHEAYVRGMKLAPEQIIAHDVLSKAPDESDLAGVSAVVVGGAKFSVWEDVPNQPQLIGVLRAAKEKKIPILGICFGAQLIAHAFGGQVVRDEAQEEWGSFEIETTDESFTDMLFADAPFKFYAQCAHHDRITRVPPTAAVLAKSQRCGVQAFTIPGTDIYGIQFHPERTKADYERLLEMKGRDYSADQGGLDKIRASLKETPEAEAVLTKFVDRILMQK